MKIFEFSLTEGGREGRRGAKEEGERSRGEEVVGWSEKEEEG